MTEHEFPPYDQMVKNLFNREMNAKWAPLMHAVVGICGEVGELAQATDRKNIREECGDLEFYMMAFIMEIPEGAFANVQTVWDPRAIGVQFGQVLHNLHTLSSNLLDISKKPWAYPDKRDPKFAEMAPLYHAIGVNLSVFYEFMGLDQGEIRYENQVKLLKGRYKTGVFSAEQAHAREDKSEEASQLLANKFTVRVDVDGKVAGIGLRKELSDLADLAEKTAKQMLAEDGNSNVG